MKNHLLKYYFVALLAICADQALKLWVDTNMQMGPTGAINLLGNMLKIQYTLNPGMAFGLHFGFKYGKLLLTTGRFVAAGMIVKHMHALRYKVSAPSNGLWGWTFVLGGAVGNLIDSTFYGVWLNNAPYNAPMRWLHGQVIDMIYFSIWEMTVPSWVPFIGNMYMAALPIFNLADFFIILGIGLILWAKRKEHATTQ